MEVKVCFLLTKNIILLKKSIYELEEKYSKLVQHALCVRLRGIKVACHVSPDTADHQQILDQLGDAILFDPVSHAGLYARFYMVSLEKFNISNKRHFRKKINIFQLLRMTRKTQSVSYTTVSQFTTEWILSTSSSMTIRCLL
jgi:hypothetical protein